MASQQRHLDQELDPVRMIAVDMDGTLLGADGHVSARTLAALQAADAAGIRVVVATGRRHGYAMRQLRSLGLDPQHTLVSSNGAVVRTLGADLIDRTFLDLATARNLCTHLGELRNALVITFDLVGADGEDAPGSLVVEDLAQLHSSIGRWMESNRPYIAHVVPIERALEGREPIQMMLCGTVERMRAAEELLLRLPGVAAPDDQSSPALGDDTCITLHRTEYPDRDLSIVDILPAGCSKGAALLQLAESWDLRPAEIMAIGDNWNDLSMLRLAGHPVLMANAPAALQVMAAEQGWQVTRSHTEDGVAEAIEAMLAAELTAPGAARLGDR